MSLLLAFLIICAGIINAAGSSVMKLATSFRSGPHQSMPAYYLLMALALCLFGGSFPIYASALSRAKLSVAQPVFSATSYLAVTLVSLLLFREPFAPLKVVGLAVIVVGMVLVVS
jgi:multidrug transporter EmrE-like cation transporter